VDNHHVFALIIDAAKKHGESKGKRDKLRAMLEPEMAKGGEVHAANGLPLTFAQDKEDPDALQNWMRERQFGKVDIPAPYKVKPEEVTVARAMRAAPAAPVDEVTQGEYGPRERLRELLQKGLGKGMSKSGAVRSADILTNAASFVAPPMLGYEGGQSLGRAYDAAKQGDYGTAAIEGGLGALNLLPALPGAKVLAKATEGMPAGLAIKAYHGSPHKFDKLDMSKIGTGEGHQSYGHGLYTAEGPKVAEEYQKKLSGDQVLFKGSPLPESTDDALNPKAFMARWALGNKMSGDALIKHWTDLVNESKAAAKEKAPDWQQKIRAKQLEQRKQLLREAKKYKPEDYSVMPQGYLYELNLRWPDAAREAADPLSPHHFLDWDKPLGKQAPHIKEAIEKTKSMLPESAMDDLGGDLSLLYGKM